MKFKDADLIGIPFRIVVAAVERHGGVGVERRGKKSQDVPVAEAAAAVKTGFCLTWRNQ